MSLFHQFVGKLDPKYQTNNLKINKLTFMMIWLYKDHSIVDFMNYKESVVRI